MVLVPERNGHETPFKRFGLGFQYRPPEAPVVMTFANVVDKRSSGELRAELHVQGATGGHILRRYLNLLGSSSTRDLVRDLGNANGCGHFPWPTILESATESIIQAIRLGPEPEIYGGVMDRPPGIRWLCEGLVMANVVNVWIAAGATGKSTFAVALCVFHAIGAPFLERATEKGIPLYLDWESDADDFKEKLWLVSRWLNLREVPRVARLRMSGAAASQAAALATRIDGLGATLVVWDGIQAAGGPVGQYQSYESVAMDLEALVGLLPPTTHLMLDHVTGDELKSDAVPRKGRGASRKYEFTRNQWTLIVDREAAAQKRHVVGWTHTKINRGQLLESFGAEVLHRPDELGFALLEEQEVEPLREKMPAWRQLMAVLQEAGKPLSNREAARLWKGDDSTKSINTVRAIVSRYKRVFTKDEAGKWSVIGSEDRAGAKGTTAANGTVDEGAQHWPEDEGWDEPEQSLPF